MRAQVIIRRDPALRWDAMCDGLKAAGCEVATGARRDPTPDDVLLVWNRSRTDDEACKRYERAGAKVIVAENGYLGREHPGGPWYALALNRHNGPGRWNSGDGPRWASIGASIDPWREDGDAIIVLAQRGIGVAPVAQPQNWQHRAAETLRKRTERPVIIRKHPGRDHDNAGLREQLRGAWAAVTWASGAGIKALLWGCPVFYGLPKWIGAAASRPWTDDIEQPFLAGRIPMFERLSWAMWTVEEIADGRAFRLLLRK